MSDYDLIYLGKKAKELGFVRDTLEKVTRLADILEYLNTNPILKDCLALKGGTAINLTIFNLPRLSVDIDFLQQIESYTIYWRKYNHNKHLKRKVSLALDHAYKLQKYATTQGA